jgi:hypothetical protein
MVGALWLLTVLMGCGQDMPEVDLAAAHEKASFLSVGGSGSDNVWVVGAQPGALDDPVVLQWNGERWKEWATGQPHTMWWVHAFDGGPTYVAGGGATVLKFEGGEVERTPTPKFFGNTVYGVWGPNPNDMWAVGGFAGRDGFVWRFDGETWTAVDLPEDLPRTELGDIPSLFKVWGSSKNDVWICGGLGTLLHWNGNKLSVIPTPTEDQLFTVTGREDEVIIVGGASSGLVLRGNLEDGFSKDTPSGAPLLQGVTVDPDGVLYVAGADGYAARQVKPTKGWELVDLALGTPQSVHALWADGEGELWGAGGSVLSPALDNGVVCAPKGVDGWSPEVTTETVAMMCPDDAIDRRPDGSIARRWVEQILDSIRRDFPHPPVHARNLHHLSVAMFDAWAAYEASVDGYVSVESIDSDDVAADREVAISYAALRLLQHRYTPAIGGELSLDCYDEFMNVLGLDPMDDRVDGDDPVAVGNRIGFAVVDRFADDGANEANDYADTTDWQPFNPIMVIDRPGTNVEDPDVWQQLNLGTAETQNGIVLEESVQPYIGPQWRAVEPFALERDAATGLYSDVGDGFPTVNDVDMADWLLEVLDKTAQLDVDDGVTLDIGPASRGNNELGTNNGSGYALNPATGEAYPPNVAKRGDFTRVVAEMWADGPTSETPPGHWVKLAQEVSDKMAPEDLIPWAEGEAVDRLEWDIGFTFSVAAAVHDGAIAAWELKRDSLGPRPITLIRWMADNGQRSDSSLPSYSPDGLPLVDGLVELVTEASSAPGERHYDLRWFVGEVAVWSWPGEPGDRKNDHTPLEWMRAKDWIPYQRRTFVTPAFPGFISGHSTFSRSAAVVMTAYTGDAFFPGGMFEFVAPTNGYLKFEAGPSEELRLQWATYFDAADEAGQSRLWGGIHVAPDDVVGRFAGQEAGEMVADKAKRVVQGTD